MLCNAYSRKRKGANCATAKLQARFSSALEELINDQGEIALVLEREETKCKIVGYTLPKAEKSFENTEIRNTYLAQSMGNVVFEDGD